MSLGGGKTTRIFQQKFRPLADLKVVTDHGAAQPQCSKVLPWESFILSWDGFSMYTIYIEYIEKIYYWIFRWNCIDRSAFHHKSERMRAFLESGIHRLFIMYTIYLECIMKNRIFPDFKEAPSHTFSYMMKRTFRYARVFNSTKKSTIFLSVWPKKFLHLSSQ